MTDGTILMFLFQCIAWCAFSSSVSPQPFDIRYHSFFWCCSNHVHHVEVKLATPTFILSERCPRSTLKVIHGGLLAVARDGHGNSKQWWSRRQTHGPNERPTAATTGSSSSSFAAGGNSVHLLTTVDFKLAHKITEHLTHQIGEN